LVELSVLRSLPPRIGQSFHNQTHRKWTTIKLVPKKLLGFHWVPNLTIIHNSTSKLPLAFWNHVSALLCTVIAIAESVRLSLRLISTETGLQSSGLHQRVVQSLQFLITWRCCWNSKCISPAKQFSCWNSESSRKWIPVSSLHCKQAASSLANRIARSRLQLNSVAWCQMLHNWRPKQSQKAKFYHFFQSTHADAKTGYDNACCYAIQGLTDECHWYWDCDKCWAVLPIQIFQIGPLLFDQIDSHRQFKFISNLIKALCDPKSDHRNLSRHLPVLSSQLLGFHQQFWCDPTATAARSPRDWHWE